MKEIKFRAWSELEDKFIYFDGIFNSKPIFSLIHWLPIGDIQQFTGLKDKNGKDIYEGDNVGWFGDMADDKFCQLVSFDDGAFYPVCTMPAENFEVIGNIYENPELLKGG